MEAVTFESVEHVSPQTFERFVHERERLGDGYRYELLQGRIIMTPPAGFPHGRIDVRLAQLLANHVLSERRGEVFGSSQGIGLPTGDTVQPDCCFITAKRWETIDEPDEGSFPLVVPDLVVEIFSKSTGSTDRTLKKEIYERNGVREYWILDWRTRDLTVFLLEGKQFGPARVFAADSRYTSIILPALTFEVSRLFE